MLNIINGNVIMLFIKQNNVWHAIAYGKQHELSVKMKKRDIHSRDHDKWSYFLPEYTEWDISCDYLYSESADYLFELFEDRQEVYVMLGLVSNYDSDGIVGTEREWTIDEGYRGKAIITKLKIESKTSEMATLSVKLEGVTSLAKVHADAPDDTETHPANTRQDPTLAFSTDSAVAQNDPTENKYSLSDWTTLINPEGLPVRYIVEPLNARLVIDEEE